MEASYGGELWRRVMEASYGGELWRRPVSTYACRVEGRNLLWGKRVGEAGGRGGCVGGACVWGEPCGKQAGPLPPPRAAAAPPADADRSPFSVTACRVLPSQ